ncbi:hypothetical protein ACN38_g12311 [Penicillium nordicum]|uniref:Uncharacterized protein n=1 Tax=Penicillium nordicum TaxID=229535 RepID=A0A0M8NPT9_9EURO|nr:hypothetical protein ACN38_g12311 [Penicillium nordicum]
MLETSSSNICVVRYQPHYLSRLKYTNWSSFPTNALNRPNPQFDAQCHGVSQLVSLRFRMEYGWIRIVFVPSIIR